MPSLPVELPPFTVAKPRKSGRAFYFQVPAHLRPEGWLPTHRLPIRSEDRTGKADAAELAAVVRDAKMLHGQMRALRDGRGPRDTVIPGSIPWLVKALEEDEDEDLGWSQLARKTQEEYSRYFNHLKAWSNEAQKVAEDGLHPHITALDGPTIRKFLGRYKASPRTRELVQSSINKLYAVAISLGEAKPTDNPLNPAQAMQKARHKKRKKTAEQVLWVPELQGPFIERCFEEGRYGLVLALGFIRYQAQRVEDALHLHSGWLQGDWWEFEQSKTGKAMKVPVAPEMRALLARVQEARGVARVGYLAVQENGHPYFGTGKRHSNRRFYTAFGEVRSALGPKFAHLEAQHLRHTRIVEWARMKWDLHQIRSWTGHSYRTLTSIIEHYLPEDEQIALAGSLRLEEFYEQGANE